MIAFSVFLIVFVMWCYRFSGHAQDNKPIKEFNWDMLYQDMEDGLSSKAIEKKFKREQYYR